MKSTALPFFASAAILAIFVVYMVMLNGVYDLDRLIVLAPGMECVVIKSPYGLPTAGAKSKAGLKRYIKGEQVNNEAIILKMESSGQVMLISPGTKVKVRSKSGTSVAIEIKDETLKGQRYWMYYEHLLPTGGAPGLGTYVKGLFALL